MIAGNKLTIQEIKNKSDKYLLGVYNKYNASFEYGTGEYLYDHNGKEYLDFMCGISVTNLGHSDADILEAIRNQSDKLIHSSNLFYSTEAADLAEALIGYSYPGKVFFCNSGTEANEAAFKLARRHGLARSPKQDPIILSVSGGFHGRTAAAMSLTGQEKIRNGFGPLVPGMFFVPLNDCDALEEAFEESQKPSALILELIQGENGVVPAEQKFVDLARKLTSKYNALLILDEIQTGIGRTGKLFAYEHYGILPDAMTLAKALGSGFPIGALVVSEKYENLLETGMHGSTFGGNHLAMIVAYETLRVIHTRDLLKNANAVSDYMFMRLGQMKSSNLHIKELRGKGLHIGVVLDIPSRPIAEKCLEKGLVVNATADVVIRIMPPLNISLEKADAGLQILESVLKEV